MIYSRPILPLADFYYVTKLARARASFANNQKRKPFADLKGGLESYGDF